MPSTAVLTNTKTAIAQNIASLTIQNVVRLEALPYPKSVVSIQTSDGKILELDISATTTFTMGPSTGNLTITITS